MNIEKPSVAIVGDFGKDLDDEHTLLYAATAHERGEIMLRGVVANLAPAEERAKLAKGTLDQIQLDIPVGVGSNCKTSARPQAYELDVPYIADTAPTLTGQEVLTAAAEVSADNSLTLILNSGLTDAAEFFENNSGLARQKLGLVAIMGGIEIVGDRIKRVGNTMKPDDAVNNTFDINASDFVYEWLQIEGIPMSILTREAAYRANFSDAFYDKLAATGHQVGVTLRERQAYAKREMWRLVNLPLDDLERGTLPDRCDRNWFVQYYLDGKDPGDVTDITKLDGVGTFQLYDPLNMAAAIHPELFRPREIRIYDTVHHIIGVSPRFHGVSNVAKLRAHILEYELAALDRALVGGTIDSRLTKLST